MQLVAKLRLFESPYTTCYISEDCFLLPDEQYYKAIGVNIGDCCEIKLAKEDQVKTLVYKVNALILQPFVKECVKSEIYRTRVLEFFNKLAGNLASGVLCVLIILEPPDKELLDYAW